LLLTLLQPKGFFKRKPAEPAGKPAADDGAKARQKQMPCTIVYVITQVRLKKPKSTIKIYIRLTSLLMQWDADAVAAYLCSSGIAAASYHAGLGLEQRDKVETIRNRLGRTLMLYGIFCRCIQGLWPILSAWLLQPWHLAWAWISQTSGVGICCAWL
jgi:hypothetical protein